MFKIVSIIIILVVIPGGLAISQLYQTYERVSISDISSTDIRESLTIYYFFIFIAATVFYLIRRIAAFLNREK